MQKRLAVKGAVAAVLGSMVGGLFGVSTADAATPPLTEVSCGQVITKSITMANDIGPCGDDGLVIGAHGVTILMDGHTIEGVDDGGTYGIRNDGFNDVTIRQGHVKDFANGVFFTSAKRSTIRNVNATSNAFNGFSMLTGDELTVVDSDATGNGAAGFVTSTPDALFEDNIASGNADEGYAFRPGSKRAVVRKNKAVGNGVGIEIQNVLGLFKRNLVSDNVGDGLVIDGGNSHEVVENRILGNGKRGVSLEAAAANLFLANEISDNESAGFFSQKGTQNVLKENLVEFNGGHGIASTEGNIKVKANRAKVNGFFKNVDDDFGLGISVPQTALGGDNIATGNDDPAQASPASLLA